MITFSIPRATAERLARLHLACASDESPAIVHIALRVIGDQVRFSATNGKILASVVVTTTDMVGSNTNCVLVKEQFTAGLKAALKVHGTRIAFKIGTDEARICNAGMESIVRILDTPFPVVDHVWSRPATKRWVPCIASLDPRLVEIAGKIAGNKAPLLLSSAVDPSQGLERIWANNGDEAISLSSMRALTRTPAYWSDGELALFIMPVCRSDAEPQLNLSAQTMVQETTAPVAVAA